MAQAIRILFPIFPSNQNDIQFLGYVTTCEQNSATIYITKFAGLNEIIKPYPGENIIYGLYNPSKKKNMTKFLNYVVLGQKNDTLDVTQLVLNGRRIENVTNSIIILYEYDKIINSETIYPSSDYFAKLQNFVQNETGAYSDQTQNDPLPTLPYWLSSSMFGQHVLNHFFLIQWILTSLKKNKKISLKQGNLILAVLIDILLGYFLLKFLQTQDKNYVTTSLMGVLERFVNLLYSLLKWLMGAPAGLKLNNAFNKMLGKYFSYHIQLWWLFLDVSGEKLDIILHIYQYIGYLGFTFQAAIISDMICLATFHLYCIYVYAARLFNIQVSGLIALLRLFVGRKYNPLRSGIDSCEYTNQELFVGTVAFTILLLLLPTTTMYYIVFTLFRLMSLLVQHGLAKIIYLVQTLPLYVVTLWLIGSPKVAGNILLKVVNNKDFSPLVLRVKLFSKSIQDLMADFKPPVVVTKHIDWTDVLSNVFVGKQII